MEIGESDEEVLKTAEELGFDLRSVETINLTFPDDRGSEIL